MAIRKRTILVSFELEYDTEALDPNAGDTRDSEKATLCDVAQYLDGLVTRTHQANNHHRFLYNLNDPEVFAVDNCTPEVISRLRNLVRDRLPEAEAGVGERAIDL